MNSDFCRVPCIPERDVIYFHVSYMLRFITSIICNLDLFLSLTKINLVSLEYWFAIENFLLSQNNLIAIGINFLSQNINSPRWIMLQFDTRSSHLIWDLYNSSFSLEHQVCNIITIHYNSSVFLLSTMYSGMYVSPCLLHVEINTSICNWDFQFLANTEAKFLVISSNWCIEIIR